VRCGLLHSFAALFTALTIFLLRARHLVVRPHSPPPPPSTAFACTAHLACRHGLGFSFAGVPKSGNRRKYLLHSFFAGFVTFWFGRRCHCCRATGYLPHTQRLTPHHLPATTYHTAAHTTHYTHLPSRFTRSCVPDGTVLPSIPLFHTPFGTTYPATACTRTLPHAPLHCYTPHAPTRTFTCCRRAPRTAYCTPLHALHCWATHAHTTPLRVPRTRTTYTRPYRYHTTPAYTTRNARMRPPALPPVPRHCHTAAYAGLRAMLPRRSCRRYPRLCASSAATVLLYLAYSLCRMLRYHTCDTMRAGFGPSARRFFRLPGVNFTSPSARILSPLPPR